MSLPEPPLDENYCRYLGSQYLLGQDWNLVTPHELARQVWQQLEGQALAGPTGVEAVQREIWQLYAEILHNCCRQLNHTCYEGAWTELRAWLSKQARRLESHPQEQEGLVQETLIDLKQRLSQTPLETPRTFLVYALQAMRRKQIDIHRQRQAVKRGKDEILSLEEFKEEDKAWDEHFSAQKEELRTMEHTVADAEIRRQLQNFFRTHLSSELQSLVAEAHFLDGLSPAEIAHLMNKQPHEIRMVKARVVQKLRSLAAVEKQVLLDILGQPNKEETDEP